MGIPYCYDIDGKLCYPDIKVYKSQNRDIIKNGLGKGRKIMGLGHQTIDVCEMERYVADVRKVAGRKKGYFSS
mgnify:FL=1